jgi:hypothetical protein
MSSNIEHIPNETLTKIMCFVDLDVVFFQDCQKNMHVLQRSVSLVSKRWRHLWYQSARDTFLENAVDTGMDVFGTRRYFRYALYHPVPHLACTFLFCDINKDRNELNVGLVHRERGVENSVMNSFRCGVFKIHGMQWIGGVQDKPEDDVKVGVSNATATTEIRDWLSKAFGELTVAHATCAPRYLTVTEMICHVNQEVRELEARYWPIYDLYNDAHNKYYDAENQLRHMRRSTPHDDEMNTKMELQKLIVKCLRTSYGVANNDLNNFQRLSKEPRARKRALMSEMEDLHMWNQGKIFSVLHKVFVGV